MMRYAVAVLAYVLPTFALGFVWHLVLFDSYYEALGHLSSRHHHSLRLPVDAPPGGDLHLDSTSRPLLDGRRR